MASQKVDLIRQQRRFDAALEELLRTGKVYISRDKGTNTERAQIVFSLIEMMRLMDFAYAIPYPYHVSMFTVTNRNQEQ